MTIRRKLSLNFLVFTGFFCLGGGVSYWASLQVDHLNQAALQGSARKEEWHVLKFLVSRYVHRGYELVSQPKKSKENDLASLTEQIIHHFLLLDQAEASGSELLSPPEKQARTQLISNTRDQFELIHSELEKVRDWMDHGERLEAQSNLELGITKAKIDQKFFQMVEQVLTSEQEEVQRIRNQAQIVKERWAWITALLFVILVLGSLYVSARVNRSIQRTIQRVNSIARQSVQLATRGKTTGDELYEIIETITQLSRELSEAKASLEQNQKKSQSTSNRAELREMAKGILLEINAFLAIIENLSGQLQEVAEDEPTDRVLVKCMAEKIAGTALQVSRLMADLEAYSKTE